MFKCQSQLNFPFSWISIKKFISLVQSWNIYKYVFLRPGVILAKLAQCRQHIGSKIWFSKEHNITVYYVTTNVQ